MASRTRASLMPRSRSWCSIMLWRWAVQAASGLPLPFIAVHFTQLFFALAEVDVKAEDSILVAHRDNRKVAIDVVLHLNYLLRLRLRHIGQVGQRNVVVDLLLNRHSRAGVVFRTSRLRIDLNAAHTENLLHPAAGRRAERLVQYHGGRRVYLALPGGVNGLLARSAKGQQRDNVGTGQGRIRTVRHIKMLERAVKANGNFVVANTGRHLQIDYRLDDQGIAESYVTPLQMIFCAVKRDIALGNVDAP